MKKLAPILLLLPLLLLAFPSSSLALVEVGAGLTVTSFEDDLDFVDTDSGSAFEISLGSGTVRLMAAFQSSSHDQGDYEALMLGPSFTLDVEGFIPRIYVLLSDHEFESNVGPSIDGTGLTLGGGVGWPIFSGASFAFDLRVSQWEGDGGIDIGTGTLQVLFKMGF
jgi:hypothetical protein